MTVAVLDLREPGFRVPNLGQEAAGYPSVSPGLVAGMLTSSRHDTCFRKACSQE